MAIKPILILFDSVKYLFIGDLAQPREIRKMEAARRARCGTGVIG
jgi:hypothetical protein